MFPHRDTIHRLTVRWRGRAEDADVPVLRSRIERYLGEVILHPPTIPPGRVLLIRQMGLNVPSGLRNVSPRVRENLHQQIMALYHRAVRPINGYIPPDAQSVLFLDYAEALAAFTQAVLRQHHLHVFPWPQLLKPTLPSGHPSELLARLWGAHAAHLPAALDQLPVYEAVLAVRLLSPSAVRQVLFALRGAFALPIPVQAEPLDYPVMPPWRPWLAQTAVAMYPEAHYLLGLVLTLRHAPTFARTSAFADQAVQWLRQTLAQTNTDNTQSIAKQPTAQPSNEVFLPLEPHSPEGTRMVSADMDWMVFEEIGVGPASLAWDDNGMFTNLAGVFFLVNILNSFQFPVAWLESSTTAMSMWAWLELIATELLTERADHDPIWNILAELDGRAPGTILEIDATATMDFRVPAAALRRLAMTRLLCHIQIDNATVTVIEAESGLTIAQAGYAGKAPDTVLNRLITDYAADGIHIEYADTAEFARHLQEDTPPMARWLRHIAAFVRYTLFQTIPDLTNMDAVLYQPGQVLVSHTHIDVVMPLDNVDVRYRRAGLDHDPGWQPDYGYILLFHFYK